MNTVKHFLHSSLGLDVSEAAQRISLVENLWETELGLAETHLNERALFTWNPMAAPAGMCCAACESPQVWSACLLSLHSLAAEALIKQYQTCPSKTMWHFTCPSCPFAMFFLFFWKSTTLDAIFLTGLHAVVMVFNKLPSEAPLLHLRLLCLLFASMGT